MSFDIQGLPIYFDFECFSHDQLTYLFGLKDALSFTGHSLFEIHCGEANRFAFFSFITSFIISKVSETQFIYAVRSIQEMKSTVCTIKEVNMNFLQEYNGLGKVQCVCLHTGLMEDLGGVAPFSPSSAVIHFCDLKKMPMDCAIQCANIVVCTHRDLFDQSFVSSITRKCPGKYFVVFDEAHQLDQVCRETFSECVSHETMSDCDMLMGILKSKLAELETNEKGRGCLLDDYEQLNSGVMLRDNIHDSLYSSLLPSNLLAGDIPEDIRHMKSFLNAVELLMSLLSDYLDSENHEVRIEGRASFLEYLLARMGIEEHALIFFSDRLLHLWHSWGVTPSIAPLLKVCNFATLLGGYNKGFSITLEPFKEITLEKKKTLRICCHDGSLAMENIFQSFDRVMIASRVSIGLVAHLFRYKPVLEKRIAVDTHLIAMRAICVTFDNDGCLLNDGRLLNETHTRRANDRRKFGYFLRDIASMVPDGIVCLFSTYSTMEEYYKDWTSILQEINECKPVLKEEKDMKGTITSFNNYRRAIDSRRGGIFLCVAGGKVFDLADFTGSYGRLIYIVGYPFANVITRETIATLQFLTKEYCIERWEFLRLEGARHASHCLGRVLDSRGDKLMIVFAGSCYNRSICLSSLPLWVLRHMKAEVENMQSNFKDAARIVNEFFNEGNSPESRRDKKRIKVDDELA